MNYLTKQPPPIGEYYYEEDFGAFQRNSQSFNQENRCQGQEIKVKTMVITTNRVTMFDMETTIATITLTG